MKPSVLMSFIALLSFALPAVASSQISLLGTGAPPRTSIQAPPEPIKPFSLTQARKTFSDGQSVNADAVYGHWMLIGIAGEPQCPLDNSDEFNLSGIKNTDGTFYAWLEFYAHEQQELKVPAVKAYNLGADQFDQGPYSLADGIMYSQYAYRSGELAASYFEFECRRVKDANRLICRDVLHIHPQEKVQLSPSIQACDGSIISYRLYAKP